MIQIAVCDDDRQMAEYTKQLILQLMTEDTSVRVTLFHSGDSLLFHTEDNANIFDIIFMDIEMPGTDGIETMLKLRKNGFKGELIYLSTIKDYVFNALDTKPLHYLVKDEEDRSKMQKILGEAKKNTIKKQKDSIFFGPAAGKVKIYLKDIVYVESKGRKVNLYTQNGACQEQYAKLSELLEEMNEDNQKKFIQIHKSFGINMDYISGIEGDVIWLENGDSVPIGKKYAKETKELFGTMLRGYRLGK